MRAEKLEFKPSKQMSNVSRGYYAVESGGHLKCSCGRPLVRVSSEIWRCSYGWPQYKLKSGDWYKDKHGDLYFKKKSHKKSKGEGK